MFLKIHIPTRMYLEDSSTQHRKQVCLVELCAAALPGVSVLVSDHFGPLAGRVLLENLVQLEVVHIGGQVTHKHRELRPVRITPLLKQPSPFRSFRTMTPVRKNSLNCFRVCFPSTGTFTRLFCSLKGPIYQPHVRQKTTHGCFRAKLSIYKSGRERTSRSDRTSALTSWTQAVDSRCSKS